MSIYAKERPNYLESAFGSLLASIEPVPELVLVKDGPLTDELDSVVLRYRDTLPIKCVELPHNGGLGPALNEGLKSCTYDWVARFDSDDLAMPERFKKQLAFIKSNPDVDVVGGWVEEFDSETLRTIAVRRVPATHKQIVSFAKRRNPFNHPAVFYKRRAVLAVGGYQDDYLLEDYGLWVRLILAGARCANIPEVLVRMRSGKVLIGRRGGVRYAASEVQLQCKFLRLGFIDLIQFTTNVMLRVPIRFLPGAFRGQFYRVALRREASRKTGTAA